MIACPVGGLVPFNSFSAVYQKYGCKNSEIQTGYLTLYEVLQYFRYLAKCFRIGVYIPKNRIIITLLSCILR